ncbi:MAG: hypothetical protein KJO60_14685 [Desulfofustis sp.]|nr:hypothetical protein [Desulfofustis sp.]NNK57576.1 hypothetical protein [Desulfofustis sp.]
MQCFLIIGNVAFFKVATEPLGALVAVFTITQNELRKKPGASMFIYVEQEIL